MSSSLLRRDGVRYAWLVLGLGGGMAALGGCSALVDPDIDDLGPPPAACVAGTVRGCVCSAGLTGVQRCTDSGAFMSCECTRAAGSGGAGRGGAGAGTGGATGASGRGQGRGGSAGSR